MFLGLLYMLCFLRIALVFCFVFVFELKDEGGDGYINAPPHTRRRYGRPLDLFLERQLDLDLATSAYPGPYMFTSET